ncbi:MAG: hypothetical protein ACTSR8_16630 [Promethearchaeota archaeon]
MLELIEIILWYIVVAIGYSLGLSFFIQYKQRSELQRPFFFGLTVFAITYSTARLIENIRRYSLGTYNDIFNAWVANTQITGINFVLRVWGYYALAWLGIAVMFYNIEHTIFKKNKYLLTIASIVEGIVSIVNYFVINIMPFIIASALFFVVMFMPLMFLNLARKTPAGKIRNACIILALGITFFAIAVMIDLPEFAYFNYLLGQDSPEVIIRIVAPVLLICGISILSIGFQIFFPKS